MDDVQTQTRILLVDDEINILRSLKRLLRRDGYEIDMAEGGAEGIRMLEESEYAVIVCDQRMPEVSGPEVLAKACELRPDTYRITLTGYTDLASAQKSINEGNIHRFLTKPWEDEFIRKVIRQGVDAYGIVVENRRLAALAEDRRVELEMLNHELEEKVQARTEQLEKRNAELGTLRDRIETSLHDTVMLLVGLLDAADSDAAAHSRRVAELSVQIATKLGLSKDELRAVQFTALLHEIGRLADLRGQGAPSRSAGKRTPRDQVSYAILSQVRGFEAVSEAVRCVSMPFGTEGASASSATSKIPMAARIVATADVYDLAAVDVSRSTDPKPSEGIAAVRRGSGTRLDPKIASVFLDSTEDAPSVDVHEIELSPKRLRVGMCVSRDVVNTLSVLLLAEDTVLTEAAIERLRVLAAEQMLPRGVFVRTSVTGASSTDRDEAGGSASPKSDAA